MNVTLPDVFDLSSLSRALDEDIAAQEHAAIDYAPMDVDDEWAPAPRPWYNPEPQPAWNNLELELENPPVEDMSQDVPDWYVNLRGLNDQLRPTWRNPLPVVSARRVESVRVQEASISSPGPLAPAPRPWHNPEPQPAWNNLELELENPPVKGVPQDVPSWYVNLREQNGRPHPTCRNLLPVVSVRRVKNACVREAPTPTPPAPASRPWHNPEPQLAWSNLELKLENPHVENAPQVQNQDVPVWYVNLRGMNDQPHPTRRSSLPVVSVIRVENACVRSAPGPPASTVSAKKTRSPEVLVSTMKGRAPVTPTPARKAGKARVPGILASTRKAEKPCAPGVPAAVRKTCALDVPASARKAEKSRTPSTPTLSSRAPGPFKSIPTCLKPVVPPRIDFTNMSSSSKVKLENMPKIDEHPVQIPISWSSLPYTIQTGPPQPTTSSYHHRNSPITQVHQTRADEDAVMFDNDYIDPTVSVPTTEDKDTTWDDAHFAHLIEHLQPIVDHAEDWEPTVEHNPTPEGDVSTSDSKEEDSEESEEETEEERQSRIALLMTEVFGDGEDSDDEEPPSAKDKAVSLHHPSTPATSGSLTVDATESITDWSLDTPDDAGTEGNGSMRVADRGEEDEERQANYHAQLLADIFGDVEDGQSIQEAPLVPVPIPATRDPRKRKREDGALSAPTLVTKDSQKRRRKDDALPISSLMTKDCRKRKRENESPLGPSLSTRDPRKRFKLFKGWRQGCQSFAVLYSITGSTGRGS